MRSWSFPGNTSDQNLVARIKDDLGSWQLCKVVMVMDSGFNSKKNRDIIRAAEGDFIIGEKLRLGPKARQVQVLATPGRYKELPGGLRIKDVTAAGGTGFGGKDDGDVRRFIIVHNPEAAERDAAKRVDIVRETERRIANLPASKGSTKHTKAVCSLTSNKTFGRYIKELKDGRLIIDKQKIARDERLDGKYLISTNNTDLPAEDIASGYKQLYEIERLNRDLKHTVDVRPVYHHKEDRIRAHVTLCWLALLLIRVAETNTGSSWLQIKRSMRQLFACEISTNAGSITQSTELTPAMKSVLDANNTAPPPRIMAIKPDRAA